MVEEKKVTFVVTPEIIVALVGLILQYGVPGVIAIIDALGKEEVTLEDIQGLKTIVKLPESY